MIEEFEFETPGGETITIEVAADDVDRKAGLSGRETLSTDEGMLFVWPEEGERQMWMKNTFVALDIIFLNGKGKVQAIETGEPHSEELLSGGEKVKYVLELVAGMADELELEVGDEIPLPDGLKGTAEKRTMKLLDNEGNVQMQMQGGERVFSRKSTRRFIELAKAGDSDKDLVKLGRAVAKEMLAQMNRETEYTDDKEKMVYDKK